MQQKWGVSRTQEGWDSGACAVWQLELAVSLLHKQMAACRTLEVGGAQMQRVEVEVWRNKNQDQD